MHVKRFIAQISLAKDCSHFKVKVRVWVSYLQRCVCVIWLNTEREIPNSALGSEGDTGWEQGLSIEAGTGGCSWKKAPSTGGVAGNSLMLCFGPNWILQQLLGRYWCCPLEHTSASVSRSCQCLWIGSLYSKCHTTGHKTTKSIYILDAYKLNIFHLTLAFLDHDFSWKITPGKTWFLALWTPTICFWHTLYPATATTLKSHTIQGQMEGRHTHSFSEKSVHKGTIYRSGMESTRSGIGRWVNQKATETSERGRTMEGNSCRVRVTSKEM